MTPEYSSTCFLFVFFAWLFGIIMGAFAMTLYGIHWIQEDPDGPGGWRSRGEQLGQRHQDDKDS